ncbi:Sodium/sulphate symporter [Ostreococcus tauri]|uniref:Sodium/sulphate symporter n=1 Tax=Ostreococcus tauri TaxID=70448 RepID=Q01AY3_OSTTA|nr:Sodium/sulphate symporter [Ostreococcus tauri]CAL51665.1 Sodium/sulphate symporter [Ostreococcus tauri]|eukprot:XP_003078785.1 Sodium/sulphate symporter [Ostreococcus tauri]
MASMAARTTTRTGARVGVGRTGERLGDGRSRARAPVRWTAARASMETSDWNAGCDVGRAVTAARGKTTRRGDRARAESSASPVARATGSDVLANWKGAKLKPLGYSVLAGLLIYLIPTPAGVTVKAWNLLAVFVATIVGIITNPLPLGAVAMIGLGVSMTAGILPFSAAFSAFSSEIPWLIALAFFLARGFIKTGLGNRIAYQIVSLFGKSTLGLTYSLVFSEALLAPAIPSLAARAGGIFLPLAKALCVACGSDPANGTEKKMGAYVMTTMFQTSTISSGMFITAMAANPLSVNLAASITGITISWAQWAIGALVPGLVCLILTPLILYVLYPPEVKESPEAPAKAKEELAALGPMSLDEKIMAGALTLTVGLWVFGSKFGIGSVAAALCGLTILLVSGVITWKECLAEGPAWDTLVWFAALIAMAGYLNTFGLIPAFSAGVVNVVSGLGLAWQPAFVIITLVYFYSHYMFASGAAHIGAMYSAFLSVLIACGAPPLVSALVLGILSNVMGCTTHYGIGSAPPFFGAGYVPLATWWKIGFGMSIVYITCFLGIGFPWWKILGYW